MKRLALLMLLACAAWAVQEHGAAPAAAPGETAAHGEASAGAGAHHEGGDPLLPAKWVNFAILAGALGFLAVKLGGPALKGQQKAILDALASAARRAAAAEQEIAAIEKKVAGLDAEIAAMRSKAATELAAESARLQKETAAAIAKQEHAADQEIASAEKFARSELKATAARLALELAGQRVKERLTTAVQGSLVDRFVTDLAAQRELRG